MYALDIKGKAYISSGGAFVLQATLVGGTMQFLDCYQIISGSAFIFDRAAGSEYVYNMITNAYTVGNTYVAGYFCAVVDNYLITANTNQPTDSPAIKSNRYNWSSPFGYTIWNPAVDRTSGFNTLSEIQNYISAIFALGNVGYILGDQTLTQLTPTGIGIQPFDATTVWGSGYGVGCTFPKTFAQYGNVTGWINDNDIYLFGGGLPQPIGGSAKNAIYDDINNLSIAGRQNMVSAVFANGFNNYNDPELTYNILIIHTAGSGANYSVTGIVWEYNLHNKTWTRQEVDILAYILSATGYSIGEFSVLDDVTIIGISKSLLSSQLGGTSGPSRIWPVIVVNSVFVIASVVTLTSVALLKSANITGQPSNFISYTPAMSLVFRQEEIKLARQPQIRFVVVKACGFGTLNITVGNVAFTSIVLNSSIV
ncbi:hypothetical protein, partial [Arachidicoccus sp.]|uniref:hypothetical protein n=1 Tax=Arachidicoccus sp. TaxID=1872624 RepID=UPI003D1DFB6A